MYQNLMRSFRTCKKQVTAPGVLTKCGFENEYLYKIIPVRITKVLRCTLSIALTQKDCGLAVLFVTSNNPLFGHSLYQDSTVPRSRLRYRTDSMARYKPVD